MDERRGVQMRQRKPFVASREFWLGVATVFFSVTIAFGLVVMFLSAY